MTYIAVAASRILETPFNEARIRYHMKFRGAEFGVGQVDPVTLWDYYTVTVDATSIEEFYQAMYNVLAFHLVDEMNGYIEHAEWLWTMSIDDIEIELLNQTVVVEKFAKHVQPDIDDAPFSFQVTDWVAGEIKNQYGIYGSKMYRAHHKLGGRYATNHCLYLFTASDEEHWVFVDKADMNAAVRMDTVGIYVWETGGFVMMKQSDFLSATQMRNATVHIMPLDLGDQDDPRMASICCHYEVPKYEYPPIMDALMVQTNMDSMANGPEASYMICAHHCFDNMSGFSAELFGPQDICIYMDALRYLLNVYQEGAKILYASKYQLDDLSKVQYRASTFFYAVIDVDAVGYPHDEPLVVYTDSFEDNLPTLDELCMIIDFVPN